MILSLNRFCLGAREIPGRHMYYLKIIILEDLTFFFFFYQKIKQDKSLLFLDKIDLSVQNELALNCLLCKAQFIRGKMK